MNQPNEDLATHRATVRAEWNRRIDEFEMSGQIGTAFCRERELPICQFRYWHKVLRQAKAASGGFVELTSERSEPKVWVECGRWRVHVGDRFDTRVLRRVAEALS